MKKGFYYLAIPYQGSEEEKKYRTELSLKITAEFLRQGIYLFAPLIYINKIADTLKLSSLEKRRALIMPYLFEFLKVSKGMILVQVEGWEKSWGIKQELKFCQEYEIPIFTMELKETYTNLHKTLSTPLNQNQMSRLLDIA